MGRGGCGLKGAQDDVDEGGVDPRICFLNLYDLRTSLKSERRSRNCV